MAYPPVPRQPWVLYFSGPNNDISAGPHVNCGGFWAQSAASGDVDIGSYRTEFLARPDSLLGGYVLSDNAGGAHSQLIGFSPDGSGYLAVVGDTRTDDAGTSFQMDFQSQGCDKIKVGAWTWVTGTANLSGVGGRYQVIRTDGVVTNIKVFVGNRVSQAFGADGVCYIGGSDHQNFRGALAYFTTWDCNQTAWPAQTTSGELFRAERVNNQAMLYQGGDYSNLALDCTVPGNLVPDMSVGLVGPLGPLSTSANYRGRPIHHGINEFSLTPEVSNGVGNRPIPYWIADSLCPLYQSLNNPGGRQINAYLGPVQTVQGSPKLWDDFSGRYSTLGSATNYPTMGSTLPTGSLGSQAWQYRANTVDGDVFNWGVFSGCAVYMGQGYAAQVPTWVTNNSADMDVRVEIPLDCSNTRNVAFTTGEAVAFRVQDATNFWVAWLSLNGTEMQLTRYNAGVATDVGAPVAMPVGYTHLRAVTSGTSITIYGGVRVGSTAVINWTSIKTTTSSSLQSATGAGMAMHGGSGGRIKNFGVY